MTTDPIRAHFRRQADACARLGSPFTAAVLEALSEALDAGAPALDPVARFAGDPRSGALALRVAGALHRIAQDGRNPDLADLYACADASRARRSTELLTSALAARRDLFAAYLALAPQTNEVGRCALLLGGFLVAAAAGGLPLVVLEIGASAGLSLVFDRYRYDFGSWSWGERHAIPSLAAVWEGARPPDARVCVAERRGCDLSPLDLRDDEARRRLRSYIWADQKDRLRQLDDAIATAREDPPVIDRADTAAWLPARLARPQRGRTTVVVHSIVWQYLADDARTRIGEAVTRRGAAASADAPLAWLRLEPEPQMTGTELRLTFWPGPQERLLGRGDWHGRRMIWLDA